MDLEGVARELHRVPPEDFVAERTARQRNVRARDRALATAIGGLRKPSPAAWVVDLLAADGALDEAIELGPVLRAAQARADPDEIATLRKQRAALVAALARTGAERAEEAGHAVTAAVVEQVRTTIEAAMSDERAGAAVRSGLLVRALESAGFAEVDLDGAVAVPDALPFPTTRPVAEPVPITAGRRGSGRRAAPGPADVDARDRTPGRAPTAMVDGGSAPSRASRRASTVDASDKAEPGRASRRAAADAGDGTEPTRASRSSRSGRRARTGPAGPGAEHSAAEQTSDARAVARDAEAGARARSRAADGALDAAEEALAAAEAERDRLVTERDRLARERAEIDRALRALDDEQAAADRHVDDLREERDTAETASDTARAAFAAAREWRRSAGD